MGSGVRIPPDRPSLSDSFMKRLLTIKVRCNRPIPVYYINQLGSIWLFHEQASKGDIPAGFIPCDGREIDEEKYPELYRRLSLYGGYTNEEGKITLPDLRGRKP